MRQHAEISLA
jgi:hypothetical protein